MIGFAFRDDYLRGVFIEFLKHTKGNMVIVLSPSAKEAAKTLLGKEANLDRQVIALESSFGDKMALAELGGALGIVN